MIPVFVCPTCRLFLTSGYDGYICHNCNKSYENRHGYIDFIVRSQQSGDEAKEKTINRVLANIENLGFKRGLSVSFDFYPSLQYRVNDGSKADWLCHCVGDNNFRCLVLASDLGNLPELLSHHYHEVYSVEYATEKIEFQYKRYQYSRRSNITILRANPLELPFRENYFDLIVFSGASNSLDLPYHALYVQNTLLSFLSEMKRVLAPRGCLYLGFKNKYGRWGFLTKSDRAGLSDISNRARNIAKIASRKYRRNKEITWKTTKSRRQEKHKEYHNSLTNCLSTMKHVGFKTKAFCSYPHYTSPILSANTADKISIKGAIRHCKEKWASTVLQTLILSLANALDKTTLAYLARLTAPSFLLYCYKDEITESIEDKIIKSTGFESYLTVRGTHGILYFLYDQKARPSKVIHSRWYKFSNARPEQLDFNSKSEGKFQNRDVWIEDWAPGREIDPLRFQESHMAFRWLIAFQNRRTSPEIMTRNHISQEANSIREGLTAISRLNTKEYHSWVDAYEHYMKTLNISLAAEHGDYWRGNILFEPKLNKINVIDWEHFKERGNPFFDPMVYIFSSMQLPSFDDFRSNLNGSGLFSPIMQKLRILMDNYFGFKLNFNVLLVYALLRYITRERTIERDIIKFNLFLDKHYILLKVLTSNSQHGQIKVPE